jgi:hypothetical protein
VERCDEFDDAVAEELKPVIASCQYLDHLEAADDFIYRTDKKVQHDVTYL